MDLYLLSFCLFIIISITIILYYERRIKELKENHKFNLDSLNNICEKEIETLRKDLEKSKKEPAPTVELKQFLHDKIALIEVKLIDPNNLFYHNIRG